MTQPLDPKPEPEPEPGNGPPSRRTTILAVIAGVLAIIVVIGIVLVATSGGDDPSPVSAPSESSLTPTVTQTPDPTDATTEVTTTETTTTEDETTTTTSTSEESSAGQDLPNPGGVVIYDCGGQAQVRPGDVSSIYCGDNSVSVTDITWSSWGPRTAVGSGTENINLCRPNCAAGNFQQRAVDVELGKPQRKGFTSITLTGTDGVTETYRLTGAAPR